MPFWMGVPGPSITFTYMVRPMAPLDYEPRDVGQHAEAIVEEDELRAME